MTGFNSLWMLAENSLADRSVDWPTWQEWQRVLLLQDYNTRVVVFGTAILGLAAGLVGSFTLLRRRALMGDALAHATLPGICAAFMLVTLLGGNGKSLAFLLMGAGASGIAGVITILYLRKYTRLKEDASLGIVLSVFFGAGTALLGIVQQMETGHAAGLEAFIYGKTASMIASDAQLIMYSAIACIVVSLCLFKELKLLCFDDAFAGARGYPVVMLDVILMAMVVVVTIVGLQAVGLVLIIALLVIPAASARFWTDQMKRLAIWSAALGAVSCLIGASLSAVLPRLPSGAMIVLASATIFVISMFTGTQRGIIAKLRRRWLLNQRMDQRHLLRAMFEIVESKRKDSPKLSSTNGTDSVSIDELMNARSWSKTRLQRAIKRDTREGYIERVASDRFRLTRNGTTEAARLVREHRLWELYLIAHADIAPSRVDRDADKIEHVLGPEMIAELEALLAGQHGLDSDVPPDPHSGLHSSEDSPKAGGKR